MKVKAPSAPEVLCWCRRCWYHLYRPWAQGWGTQSWSSWCCWRRRCRLFSFSSPGQWSRGRWWRYTELQGLTRLNRERNIISACWAAEQSDLHSTGRRGGGCRRWRASASLSYSASCPAARWGWGPSGWRRRSWHSGSCLSPSCWRWSSASLNQMKYFKLQPQSSVNLPVLFPSPSVSGVMLVRCLLRDFPIVTAPTPPGPECPLSISLRSSHWFSCHATPRGLQHPAVWLRKKLRLIIRCWSLEFVSCSGLNSF